MKRKVPPSTYEYLDAETLEVSRGQVRRRFRPAEAMANPWGAVQGGILAAFFDDATGPAVFPISGGRG